MKKIIVSIFFILFSVSNVYATKYMVEKEDGRICILNYKDGSADTLENVIEVMGWSKYPIIPIKDSDLPDRRDRDFWMKNPSITGKKIIVDQTKKDAAEQAKAQKKAKEDVALVKIGLTRKEMKDMILGE